MLIENWIVTRLLASDAVKAIVDARVYPVAIVQGAPTPAITFKRTGTRREGNMTGPDRQPRVSFRVQAFVKGRWDNLSAYQRSKQIMAAMLPLFNEIREKPPAQVSQFYVAHCRVVNEADMHEAVSEGSEELYYAPFMDLEIDHKE